MCSLSWSRGRNALVVVMNRDERRDRTPARPPRRWRGGDVGFIAPLDPEGGGSWIAVRDSGLVIALLNHHPPAGSSASAASGRPSRGRLVTTLAGERDTPDAWRLRAAGLAAYAPFRLFVAGPASPPRVFTWDGTGLRVRRLHPRLGFLTSSSWNARAVLPVRHARFRALARRHAGRPPRAALVAFHDHVDDPRGTPWAICMARDDVRTVSTTVVDAGRTGVSMRYRRR